MSILRAFQVVIAALASITVYDNLAVLLLI